MRNDWRCNRCGKLLGIVKPHGLHLRADGQDYFVSVPATTNCRGCRAFNELRPATPDARSVLPTAVSL